MHARSGVAAFGRLTEPVTGEEGPRVPVPRRLSSVAEGTRVAICSFSRIKFFSSCTSVFGLIDSNFPPPSPPLDYCLTSGQNLNQTLQQCSMQSDSTFLRAVNAEGKEDTGDDVVFVAEYKRTNAVCAVRLWFYFVHLFSQSA
jgi:hypothetical protein